MKLKDILAISGYPGLFKFLAQSKSGIIVESLADAHRMNVPASTKVSSMGEIALYTDSEDMPLGKVFEALYAKTSGKETISHKSSPDQLKTLFEEVVPHYDRDQVHVSDMKKIISWYNTLISAGFTDFTVEEENDDTGPDPENNKSEE